ncbi:MAG: BcsE family c-di-GMP-binding protein [Pseudomonadota bacterium]
MSLPVPLQNPYTLGLGQVGDEVTRLRRGGVYWITLDRVDDADRFCRQVLGSLLVTDRAVLITAGRDPQDAVRALPDTLGPGDLRLFSLDDLHTARALRDLSGDLDRALRPRDRLILLMLPSARCVFDVSVLAAWCQRWVAWLEQTGCTLLVLSHGDDSAMLSARLLPLNHLLSGLAHLLRKQGRVHYLRQYWRNSLSVTGARELILEPGDNGFSLLETAPLALRGGNDEDLILAQVAVLEGAPRLSSHWEVFDNLDDLFLRALQAQSATVIFAMTGNAQVADLARRIHSLRTQRGATIKLVVREMKPCLRHNDEQVLLLWYHFGDSRRHDPVAFPGHDPKPLGTDHAASRGNRCGSPAAFLAILEGARHRGNRRLCRLFARDGRERLDQRGGWHPHGTGARPQSEGAPGLDAIAIAPLRRRRHLRSPALVQFNYLI